MSSIPPSTLSSDLFRRACARFATGVAIAAVLDEFETPHGMTINSFTSVSLTPPLVLICIDRRTTILERFLRAPHYGLSFLKEDQREISNRFALRVDDRFDGIAWCKGEAGAPILEDCLATMECATRQIMEAGDHTIFLAEVITAEAGDGEPLLFYNSGYREVSGD